MTFASDRAAPVARPALDRRAPGGRPVHGPAAAARRDACPAPARPRRRGDGGRAGASRGGPPRRRAPGPDPARPSARCGRRRRRAPAQARAVADRLREICGDLRLPILDDLGVGPALDWLVLRIERLAGGEVRLERSDGTRPPAGHRAGRLPGRPGGAGQRGQARPAADRRPLPRDRRRGLAVDRRRRARHRRRRRRARRRAGGHFGLLNMQQRAEAIGAHPRRPALAGRRNPRRARVAGRVTRSASRSSTTTRSWPRGPRRCSVAEPDLDVVAHRRVAGRRPGPPGWTTPRPSTSSCSTSGSATDSGLRFLVDGR